MRPSDILDFCFIPETLRYAVWQNICMVTHTDPFKLPRETRLVLLIAVHEEKPKDNQSARCHAISATTHAQQA